MGPLTMVYNIASNKPPRYHDDPEYLVNGTPPSADELDNYSDEALLPPSDDSPSQSLSKRGAQQIPESVRHTWAAAVKWAKGPDPPRPWSITPIFQKLQTAPIRFMDIYVPERRHRFFLLMLLYIGWIISFALVLRKSAFTSDVPGYGSPVRISCGTSFW